MSTAITVDRSAHSRIRIALQVAVVIAAAAVLYLLFGYWRFSWMGTRLLHHGG